MLLLFASSVLAGTGATAAEHLSGASHKAAVTLDKAAAGMKGAADTASTTEDRKTEAAAAAAGKAAGVISTAGGDLAATAADAAGEAVAPAVAAAEAAGQAGQKLAQHAQRAAQSVSESLQREGGEEGLHKGLQEAPAAVKDAAGGVLDSAIAAGGQGQLSKAGEEVGQAAEKITSGLRGAVGRVAEAMRSAGITKAVPGKSEAAEAEGIAKGSAGDAGEEEGPAGVYTAESPMKGLVQFMVTGGGKAEEGTTGDIGRKKGGTVSDAGSKEHGEALTKEIAAGEAPSFAAVAAAPPAGAEEH